VLSCLPCTARHSTRHTPRTRARARGDAAHAQITSLYSDETTKFTFKRPITVVALESRYASRKTREFVTGDVRGRLKLSSQVRAWRVCVCVCVCVCVRARVCVLLGVCACAYAG
jgi:hypothetical protein